MVTSTTGIAWGDEHQHHACLPGFVDQKLPQLPKTLLYCFARCSLRTVIRSRIPVNSSRTNAACVSLVLDEAFGKGVVHPPLKARCVPAICFKRRLALFVPVDW